MVECSKQAVLQSASAGSLHITQRERPGSFHAEREHSSCSISPLSPCRRGSRRHLGQHFHTCADRPQGSALVIAVGSSSALSSCAARADKNAGNLSMLCVLYIGQRSPTLGDQHSRGTAQGGCGDVPPGDAYSSVTDGLCRVGGC
jgi:hypothetical protein